VVFGGWISKISGRGPGGTRPNGERFSAVRCRSCRSSLYVSMGRNPATAPSWICAHFRLPAARYAIGFCWQRTAEQPQIFLLLGDDNGIRRVRGIATGVWSRELLVR